MNQNIFKIWKFFVFALFFTVNNMYAQDIVFKKNGDEIKTKVLEVNILDIKYKKWENQQGPLYTLPKNEIFMIKYQNGDKDVFKEEVAEKIETPLHSLEDYKKNWTQEAQNEQGAYAILIKYIQAIGGFETINRVKNIVIHGAGKLSDNKGNMLNASIKEISSTSRNGIMKIIFPQRNLEGKAVCYNGVCYTIEAATGKRVETPADERQKTLDGSHPFIELLWLEKENITQEPDELINNKRAYVIKCQNSYRYYDVTTGLLVASKTYNNKTKSTSFRYYDDYRNSYNFLIPYNIIEENEEMQFSYIRNRIEINQSLSENDFK